MKTQTKMHTMYPMHKQIKEQAKAYQKIHVGIGYNQSLDAVAKTYGFVTYQAFKVLLDKNNKNPFNIEFNKEWLSYLLSKGIINQKNKDDISVLAWSKRLDTGWIQSEYNFSTPFMDLKKTEKDFSFIEKVAQSITMLGQGTEGWMTGRGSSYGHRDYVTSTFDYEMLYGTKYLIESINDLVKYKGKIRYNHHVFDSNSVFFVEFNFEKEETILYMKSCDGNLDYYKNLFYSNKQDFVLPFVFESFPFYNVSKIILFAYGRKEGVEISKTGTKNLEFSDDYFSM